MNKKLTKTALKTLCISFAFTLWACDPAVDYPVDPTMQQIAAHEWKVKDIKVTGTDGADSLINLPCHITGAHIFFSLNYQFSFADSTVGGCDSTIFPYDAGVWGLKISRDSLLFQGQKKRFTAMKLMTVNSDSLQLSFFDSAALPAPIRKTITLIK